MNEKVLKRKVEEKDFYHVYLKTLNGHMALTNRELEVLVQLCKSQAKYLAAGYEDEKLSKILFSAISREEIRTLLDISPFNLNNIIKSLRTKGVLMTTNSKKYIINPKLFVPSTDKEYTVTFKIEVI